MSRYNNSQLEFIHVSKENFWNETLGNMPYYHFYSSWSWGEYKRQKGWEIKRVAVQNKNSGKIEACYQIQTKRFIFFKIFLIQGGIACNNDSKSFYSLIIKYLKNLTNYHSSILFVDNNSNIEDQIQIPFIINGFIPTKYNSYNYLAKVDDAISMEKNLTKNWRKNLRKAKKNIDLKAKWVQSEEEKRVSLDSLFKFYKQLATRKKFKVPIDFDIIKNLIINDNNFKVLKAFNGNETLSVRVVYDNSINYFDFLAASSPSAIKTYASYLLVWNILISSADEGYSFFDFGGIDPRNNQGVYNFKIGIEGKHVIDSPLWAYTNNSLINYLFI